MTFQLIVKMCRRILPFPNRTPMPGLAKSIAGTRAKARPSPKVLGPLVVPSKLVLDARTGNWKPQINEALAKQVAQDLHLSSDGSDSENPEETNKDTPADEDLLPPADTTWTESGTLTRIQAQGKTPSPTGKRKGMWTQHSLSQSLWMRQTLPKG